MRFKPMMLLLALAACSASERNSSTANDSAAIALNPVADKPTRSGMILVAAVEVA